MIVVTKTCEHCGCEYSYIVSGYGISIDKTNDKHLCPECKSAVLSALDKIPVKFVKSHENCTDKISKEDVAAFITSGEKYFEEQKRESEIAGLPMMFRIVNSADYDYFIEFYFDEKKYELFYNTKDDYKIRCEAYLKADTNEFDRFVKYRDKKDLEIVSYVKCRKSITYDMVPVQPMEMPTSKLLYMDSYMDCSIISKHKKPKYAKRKKKETKTLKIMKKITNKEISQIVFDRIREKQPTLADITIPKLKAFEKSGISREMLVAKCVMVYEDELLYTLRTEFIKTLREKNIYDAFTQFGFINDDIFEIYDVLKNSLEHEGIKTDE